MPKERTIWVQGVGEDLTIFTAIMEDAHCECNIELCTFQEDRWDKKAKTVQVGEDLTTAAAIS